MRKIICFTLLCLAFNARINSQQVSVVNAGIDPPAGEENLNVFQQWIKWNNPGSLLINHLMKKANDLYAIKRQGDLET